MQVSETLAEGLKREFKIVIGAADIGLKIEDRLVEVGRQARLPGFRPGKVPLKVLKQRFGASVLGEVVEGAVQESTNRLMQERGLRPAMTPQVKIKSYDEGQDLEFDMKLEVLPEIEHIDFSTLELERLRAEVTDQDVEDSLTRLAEAQKRTQPVTEERAARAGDVVVIDYEGKIDGETFAGGAGKGEYLELGAGGFIPGFEEQIVGQMAAEPFQVTVTFPEAYPPKELAGKEAKFDCNINQLREPAPVSIDDDLAKALGFETLEELRQSVRDRLQRDYGQFARARLKRELLDKLADSHHFEIPDGLVTREFDQIWKQLEHAREHDELDEVDAKKSDDELRTEYRAIAERRVRLGLLLSDVGTRNKLTVGQEEVHRAIMEEARRYPGREQQVIEYFRGNEDAQASLKAPIFEDKVVDFIAEMAKVDERPVSAQELLAMAEDANAPAEDRDHGAAASKGKKRSAKKGKPKTE